MPARRLLRHGRRTPRGSCTGLNPGSPKYCGLEIVSGRHLPDDWQGNLHHQRLPRPPRLPLRAQRRRRRLRLARAGRADQDATTPPSGRSTSRWARTARSTSPTGTTRSSSTARSISATRAATTPTAASGASPPRAGRSSRGRSSSAPPIAGAARRAQGARGLDPAAGQARAQGARGRRGRCRRWRPGSRSSTRAIPDYEHHRLEALWTYQSLDVVEPELLDDAARRAATPASAPRRRGSCRTGTTGCPTRWRCWPPRVDDDHPRVRLEAVRALAQIPEPRVGRAGAAGARPAGRPVPRLRPLADGPRARSRTGCRRSQAGELDFGGNPRHLVFALQAVGSPDVRQAAGRRCSGRARCRPSARRAC